MQTCVSQHIYSALEQLFEILTEAHNIQEGSVWFHVNQEVDVTSSAVVPSPDRAKQSQIACAVSCGDLHDLVSLLFEIHGLALDTDCRPCHQGRSA